MFTCRHCGSLLFEPIIDLGHQPPSNGFLSKADLIKPETTYPLLVYCCTSCWLIQLPAHKQACDLFTPEYAYFSSVSSSWCKHSKDFVDNVIPKLNLNTKSLVVEIGSNDGYLLQFFKERQIPCLGIEPTIATANRAISRGIKTIKQFFDSKFASSLDKSDLIVINNVLAHVPDINDFMAGVCVALNSTGFASVEFPHILKLLQFNQFDTIYHEHYSYLSLKVVKRIANAAGLEVIDVEELETHGGSLRVWLAHSNLHKSSESVDKIIALEDSVGLESLNAYRKLQNNAENAKDLLYEFLINSKASGKRIIGYGAAAKGNTLINFAGIRKDLLPFVADKSDSKIGKFLPGSHIQIIDANELFNERPDSILLLPWNIESEIKAQLPNTKIYAAIPKLRML